MTTTTTIKAPVLRAMLKLRDDKKPQFRGVGCAYDALFTTDGAAILLVKHPGIAVGLCTFDPAHVPVGDAEVDLTTFPVLGEYKFPPAIKDCRGPVTTGAAPFVDAKYLNIFISVLRALGDRDPGNIRWWCIGALTSKPDVAVVEKHINGFRVRMVVSSVVQMEGEVEAI